MKDVSLLGWLLLLTTLCTAIACTDHRDVPTLRYRVRTITNGAASSADRKTFILSYNDGGKLLSGYSEDPINVETSGAVNLYINGFLDQMTRTVSRRSILSVLNYVYDTQGRLTTIMVRRLPFFNSTIPTDNDKVIYTFTYDGNSTLPSSRITARFEAGVSIGSKTETYTFTGGNATTINGATFTYDNTPNPYRGLFGFSFSPTVSNDYSVDVTNTIALNRPFDIGEVFSNESVKVFNQNNRTTGAQLTYNSSGLVSKITYDNGKVEEFTYETY